MVRARQFLIDRDIATVPPDERIEVVETPEYLRNVIPFAAYFSPPKFDPSPQGIYIVTPSVGHDPNAMREHNYSSISNTSIHEAYPGHHLQLTVANGQPSLTRLVTDAPEFVEGWGMYSEQMMREQGFDAAPELPAEHAHRRDLAGLPDHPRRPDAPRRVSIEEAIRFLVEQTSFEEANARAEVRATPTRRRTSCRTCSARSCCSSCGPTSRPPRRRVLARGLPRHAARNGSLPISFHRRLLRERSPRAVGAGTAGAGARAPALTVQVIPSIDLDRGRSRVVFWPGASPGVGAPTDRPERIAEQFVERGAG
jgi:hypothetical protein